MGDDNDWVWPGRAHPRPLSRGTAGKKGRYKVLTVPNVGYDATTHTTTYPFVCPSVFGMPPGEMPGWRRKELFRQAPERNYRGLLNLYTR